MIGLGDRLHSRELFTDGQSLDLLDGQPRGDRLLLLLPEAQDSAEHTVLLLDGGVRVDLIVGALLEVILAQHPRNVEHGFLPFRQCIDAHQLHDLLELGLLLECLHRLLTQGRPIRGDVRAGPRVEVGRHRANNC